MGAVRGRQKVGDGGAVVTVLLWAGTTVVATVAWFLALPGAVVALVGWAVAALTRRPPELTGPRAAGRPTPADQREQDLLTNCRAWRAALSPAAWGWSAVTCAHAAAVSAAAVAACVPQAWWQARVVDAVAAAAVALMEAARRRAARSGDTPMPPAKAADVPRWWRASPVRATVAAVVVAAVAAAASARAAAWLAADPVAGRARDVLLGWLGGWAVAGMVDPAPTPVWAWAASSAAAGGVAGLWLGVRRAATRSWRLRSDAVRTWRPAFAVVKTDAPPRLVDAVEIPAGDTTGIRLTWEAPPVPGAGAYVEKADQVRRALGDTGGETVLAAAGAVDPVSGRPTGTPSTTRFCVLSWPCGFPDVTGTDVPEGTVAAVFETVMAMAAQTAQVSVLPGRVARATADGEKRAAWRVDPGMTSESFEAAQDEVVRLAGAVLGCDAVVDAYPQTEDGMGGPRLYAGALDADGWADDVVDVPAGHPRGCGPVGYFDDLRREDQWVEAWKAATNGSGNYPLVDHAGRDVKQLVVAWRGAGADARPSATVDVELQPFLPRVGVSVQQKLLAAPVRAAMTTAFQPPRPMVWVGWERDRAAPQNGARSDKTIVVMSSEGRVPPPHRVPPQPAEGRALTRSGARPPESAALWVAQWWMGSAFEQAGLDVPETWSAECLTDTGSREHVWLLRMRLHGRTQLKDVLGKMDAVRSAVGAPWLRAAPDEGGGVMVVAGADPMAGRGETGALGDGRWTVVPDGTGVARVSMPDVSYTRALGVVWQKWWVDAGCVTRDGAAPVLESVRPLPDNPRVEESLHRLPSGLTVQDVKTAQARVSASSGNAFVQVGPGPSPSHATVLTAVTDPMPDKIAYPAGEPSSPRRLPMGVGVDGGVAAVDLEDVAHVLLSGTTGSGKSWSVTALLVSAIRAGCDVFVVDPEKKAQDFRFLEPWLRGLAVTHTDAAGMVKALAAEAERRMALCLEHGVAHVDRLPDGARPPHLVVLVDEVTELVKLPQKPDAKPDPVPALEEERQRQWAEYTARVEVGAVLGRFGRIGRSVGMHIVAATQVMKSASLPASMNDFKNNTNRCFLGSGSWSERAIALKAPESSPDPGEAAPRGRGVWEPVLGKATLVQFFGTPPDEYRALLEAEVAPVTEKFAFDEFLRGGGDEFAAFTVIDDGSPPEPEPVVLEAVSWEAVAWGDSADTAGSGPEDPAAWPSGTDPSGGGEDADVSVTPVPVGWPGDPDPLPVGWPDDTAPVAPPPDPGPPPAPKPLTMGDVFSTLRRPPG